MRAALLVARIELKRRLRNRSAVFTAFVGPLVLASVFGILLGGTSSFTLEIGVVDADHSALTTGFVSGLLDRDGDAGDGPVVFVALPDQQTALRKVDDEDLDAAIVLPSGFGAAVTSGRAANVTVVRNPRNEISAGVAASVAHRYTASLSSRSLTVATVTALGGRAPTPSELASLSDSLSGAVTRVPPGGREVDAAAAYGVSMSILFLFFTVAFAARSLIEERTTGLIPRILATPTSVRSIVVGKVAAVCALGFSGFLTVWGVTSLAFGAPWGDPLAVVVTMALTVLAVGAVATFVCGLAKTAEQADGYTSAVAFALALLGGNFVGPGQAPEALRKAAAFTPNGQSIDAFTRIAADGAGLGAVGRQLAMLGVFTLAFGAVGMALIGRTVRR